LSGQHFQVFAELHDVTPDLRPGLRGLGFVRMYYHGLQMLGKVAGRFSASVVEWTERERVLCARYAAVQIDRRLQSQSCAGRFDSFLLNAYLLAFLASTSQNTASI